MKVRLLRILAVLVIATGLSGAASAAEVDEGGASKTHVFLLRGFMNVFSFGLDEFAHTLQRNGIRADVYNHVLEQLVVQRAAEEYRSGKTKTIILIGHSMGVASVIQIISDLGQMHIPVALALTMAADSLTIPSGYAQNVIHMYTETGGPLIAGPGFHGHLTNLDLSNEPGVNHLTIDKDQIVQSMMLGYITRTIQSRRLATPQMSTPRITATLQGPQNELQQNHATRRR
jgi:hypothetical protein